MDKIKQLLEKSGLSTEAASQICESLDSYTTQVKQNLDEEFKARLEKAKKVCLEETEAHKAELSRRVQVFLETKGPAIEETLTRQMAERETESVAKLERIAAVIEGIQLDGQSNSELAADVTKLKQLAEHLMKERDHAVKRARDLTSISERLVAKNREMQKALVEQLNGGDATPGGQQKIDEARKGGDPKTTRPTIRENVDPTPPEPAAGPDKSVSVMEAPKSPEDIASTMEEVV